ncbi:MAG TPA: 3-isopropylmalate dehydratase small subunit, partial [Tabrizicola sp.]|nr:3-isopropylmalate dehydratase small subunit [Tabrizicola sp.]
HAPWALLDVGIRSVISTSFADIFYNNCFKNGILPIVLPQEAIDHLMDDAKKGENARITIDLDSQTVTASDGKSFAFEVDPFKKHCLMNGLDDIGLTLEKAAAIDTFETRNATLRPWA